MNVDRRHAVAAITTAALAATTLTACGSGEDSIDGAGPGFLATLVESWEDSFEFESEVELRVDYHGADGGDAIAEFLAGGVDWASADRSLTEDELAEAERGRGCPVVQVPTLFAAVAITFGNVQLDQLVLDAEVLSRIYRGEITHYQDAAIAALNPGRALPDQAIVPVHDSEMTGITLALTTWLSDEDEDWRAEIGPGLEVDWPAGAVGGGGPDDVRRQIAGNPGGLGYVHHPAAQFDGLPMATIVNADGNAVFPTRDTTIDGMTQVDVPADFAFSVRDVGGDGYPVIVPIWSFFWECGYEERTATRLRDFWMFAIGDGQEQALSYGYAPAFQSGVDGVSDAVSRIGGLG